MPTCPVGYIRSSTEVRGTKELTGSGEPERPSGEDPVPSPTAAHTSARFRLLAVLQAFLLVASLVAPLSVLAEDPVEPSPSPNVCSTAGQLTTDQASYLQADTVHFTGSGFGAGCELTITVAAPDASNASAPVTTDGSGTLAYEYTLASDATTGSYAADARDSGGASLAGAVAAELESRLAPRLELR